MRRSPHVLYTNCVEPVLRWHFAEHGIALVHAACVAVDDRAYLITARTDTGKTTTILKLLDAFPRAAFISDDLTLVAPDGTVASYPKPLTISQHTLHAVRTPEPDAAPAHRPRRAGTPALPRGPLDRHAAREQGLARRRR